MEWDALLQNLMHFSWKSYCSYINPLKIYDNPIVLEKIFYTLKGSEMPLILEYKSWFLLRTEIPYFTRRMDLGSVRVKKWFSIDQAAFRVNDTPKLILGICLGTPKILVVEKLWNIVHQTKKSLIQLLCLGSWFFIASFVYFPLHC